MNCPKCGAAQADGREDCSACGIVFARYQPNAPRRTTLSSSPLPPPAEAAQSGGIPTVFIVVGVFFAIVLGLIWTRHHRSEREKAQSVDILNEINNKGAHLRQQLSDEAARMDRAQRASMTPKVSAKLPSDLPETKIRELIEGCKFFQEPISVEVPKSFQVNIYRLTLEQYPALPMAQVEHLVEFDPPSFNASEASRYLPNPANPGDTVNVKLTEFAYQKAEVSEIDNGFRFGLGRRRIESITRTFVTSESAVTATFKWTYEQSGAANLSPDRYGREGGAQFNRTANGWTATQVWQNTPSGANILCP